MSRKTMPGRLGNMVALNVKKDNAGAIKCYENLGFEIYCDYEESLFTRTG
jgi:ribosomal protein S18 acetylase RimI-like enzyme